MNRPAQHGRYVGRVEEYPKGVRRPVYRQIADALRAAIIAGKHPQGSRLPPTTTLAASLGTSYLTLHRALQLLAKEGWVERRKRSGTFIADLQRRFTTAAIYTSVDVLADPDSFQRNLHFALLNRLNARHKQVEIFTDSRPFREQANELFPPLAQAVANQRVQCVICAHPNEHSMTWLPKLRMPTAFLGDGGFPNCVEIDLESLLRGAATAFANQGCRSIGVISSLSVDEIHDPFYKTFKRIARHHGFKVRDEWIRRPAHFVANMRAHGYQQMLEVTQLAKLPEGLLVWPEPVVEGAMIALLRTGLDLTGKMKFVFHRNSRSQTFAPFPVTWALVDEAEAAAAMVKIIDAQFEGEAEGTIRVPFRLEKDEALQWQPIPPR